LNDLQSYEATSELYRIEKGEYLTALQTTVISSGEASRQVMSHLRTFPAFL
jgi:hypothetical protein